MEGFLQHDAAICRPLIDFKANTWSAEEIQFFSDATKSKNCGCGGWFHNRLHYTHWEEGFIEDCGPSIEFLELFTVAVNIKQ